ncbi:MAG: hypothetical protein LBR69_03070 [Endomicrobium sp.]|jgi:hypothetical protein|nr:hypothetical protein [Endomicrobium sp.]
MSFTHKDITIIATKYAKRLFRCPIGAWEFCIEDEKCDGFLVRHHETFLIEAKVSMEDFKRDKKKDFRIYPEKGVGTFRLYAAPEGLLKLEDLPEKWGLIEVNEKGKCSFDYRITAEEISDREKEKNERRQLYIKRGWDFDENYMPVIKNEYWFRHKYRKFEKDIKKELAALYYLAQRYKNQKFMNNIL